MSGVRRSSSRQLPVSSDRSLRVVLKPGHARATRNNQSQPLVDPLAYEPARERRKSSSSQSAPVNAAFNDEPDLFSEEEQPRPSIALHPVVEIGSYRPVNGHTNGNPAQAISSDNDLGGYGDPEDVPAAPAAGPSSTAPLDIDQKQAKLDDASGSEFAAPAGGDPDDEDEYMDADGSDDEQYTAPKSRSKRRIQDTDEEEDEAEYNVRGAIKKQRYTSRSGRTTARRVLVEDSDDDEFDLKGSTRQTRSAPGSASRYSRPSRTLNGFVEDDEADAIDSEADFDLDPARREAQRRNQINKERQAEKRRQQEAARELDGDRFATKPKGRSTRNSRAAAIEEDNDTSYQDTHDSDDGRSYSFRRRDKEVNYAIPTLESALETKSFSNVRHTNGPRPKKNKLPLNMTGRQLERFFSGRTAGGGDSSVS